VLTVVVLGAFDKRIAFVVERVLDEQEVLVKSLGKQLTRVRNITAATVLGSGKIVPILNVHDLLKSALSASTQRAAGLDAVDESKPGNSRFSSRRILLLRVC
jgi:two-component system chemotaxis sensor kinase CheA